MRMKHTGPISVDAEIGICLSNGIEHFLTVSVCGTYTPGQAETGPRYDCAGEPAIEPEISDLSVWLDDKNLNDLFSDEQKDYFYRLLLKDGEETTDAK